MEAAGSSSRVEDLFVVVQDALAKPTVHGKLLPDQQNDGSHSLLCVACYAECMVHRVTQERGRQPKKCCSPCPRHTCDYAVVCATVGVNAFGATCLEGAEQL